MRSLHTPGRLERVRRRQLVAAYVRDRAMQDDIDLSHLTGLAPTAGCSDHFSRSMGSSEYRSSRTVASATLSVPSRGRPPARCGRRARFGFSAGPMAVGANRRPPTCRAWPYCGGPPSLAVGLARAGFVALARAAPGASALAARSDRPAATRAVGGTVLSWNANRPHTLGRPDYWFPDLSRRRRWRSPSRGRQSLGACSGISLRPPR